MLDENNQGKQIQPNDVKLNPILEIRGNLYENGQQLDIQQHMFEHNSEDRPQNKMPQPSEPEPLQYTNRFHGLSFIILQIGVMIGHGLSAIYYVQTSLSNVSVNQQISIILYGLFAIVGFGLVISIYQYGNWLGLSYSFVVYAISVQLSPLIQSLLYVWFLQPKIQVDNASIYKNIESNVKQFLIHYFNGYLSKIQISSYLYRVALASCLSLLVMLTALAGRLNMIQLFKIIVSFQVFWHLNFFILLYFCVTQYSFVFHQVFDTYGSSYIYLFAAFYGLGLSLLMNNHAIKTTHQRNSLNQFSWLLSIIGCCFITATFCFTYTNLISYVNYQIFTYSSLSLEQSYKGQNYMRYSILFGIMGSIIGSFVGQLLVNKGRLTYRGVIVCTLMGGIANGASATYIMNIGIAIGIGFASSLISSLLATPLNLLFNKNKMFDVLGLFGPILISSIIGSTLVPIIILSYYIGNSIRNQGISQSFNSKGQWTGSPSNMASYQLIYAGLSAGFGLAGGLLNSLLCRWETSKFAFAANGRLYENDYGLTENRYQLSSQVQKQSTQYQNLVVSNNNKGKQQEENNNNNGNQNTHLL